MITKSAAICATALNSANDFKKSDVIIIIETVLDKFEEGLIEGLEQYYEEQEEKEIKENEDKNNVKVHEIKLSDEEKKKIDGLLDGLVENILRDIISK